MVWTDGKWIDQTGSSQRTLMQRARSLVRFCVAIATIAIADTSTWAANAQEEAIRQIIAEHNTAWNAGDALAWTKDFADDADFINILGTLYQGKEETRLRHAELSARSSREVRCAWMYGR
jgi:hypothetical protein